MLGGGIVANDVDIVEIIETEARRALKIVVRFTIRVESADAAADTQAALDPRTATLPAHTRGMYAMHGYACMHAEFWYYTHT